MSSYGRRLVIFLVISLPFALQEACDSFGGLKETNFALLGYTFNSSNAGDSFSCADRCVSHGQCKSYNYALSGPQQGLCELNSVGRYAALKPLLDKPGFVYVDVVTRKPVNLPKSCVDHWQHGARVAGIFPIHRESGTPFDVYCDFQKSMVWTLVTSQSFKNRALPEFKSTPLYKDGAVNEETPNWDAYRLSLDKMTYIKSISTHWQITCDFPTIGLKFTDYVRAKFEEFDALTFKGSEVCKLTEQMNVRGHECTGCQSAWWQDDSLVLNHDSSSMACEFGRSPGYVGNEDNFGYYDVTNPAFRCSSSDTATTNRWFSMPV